MKTATKKLAPPRRMTAKQRLDEMHAFTDLCFAMLDEPIDMKELANRSQLSLTTLYRLRSHESTLYSRYGTIQALGIACGLQLVSNEYGYRVVVID